MLMLGDAEARVANLKLSMEKRASASLVVDRCNEILSDEGITREILAELARAEVSLAHEEIVHEISLRTCRLRPYIES
ncbi:hypothetical protein [Paraburkholderia sp. A1RO-5L]|uniref:hypothetical protein n=1 Tax=Paraburkholderia sp. A1RO-5L TaxID=3028370 RepID=UPI003B7F2D91